ncbi:MAG TPA: BamA/TamA family outer membrane protein [Bacteroidales bacterium]|nr:BamA/TamA family outer membrane protein [Bacteroidales bacterium]
MKIAHILCFLCITITFSGCVQSRLLKKNEYTYGGAKIKIESDTTIQKKGKLASMLKDQTYPLPNNKTLGLPIKLWIYSLFGNGFIGNNYGERPVLLKDVPTEDVAASLQTVLKANGYLQSRVEAKVKKSTLFKYERKVEYTAHVKAPYFLRNLTTNFPDSAITHIVDSISDKSLVHSGDQYNLIRLKDERERIDKVMKNKGYYYFSPNFLYYVADSSVGNRNIDLSLQIQEDINPSNLKPWTIENVTVIDNQVADTAGQGDVVHFKGVDFITSKKIKPKRIRHFILFQPGGLLTSDSYNLTNRNLSAIGAFLYVNTDAIPDTINNTSSAVITLTPHKKHNIKLDAEMVSKSNNFAGPNLSVSYINRNIFGGSEQFTFRINGGLEAWLQKRNSEMLGDFNYEFGAMSELRFPRFLFFNPSLFSGRYIPSNHIRADVRYVSQARYYKMWFANAGYGFRWTETNNKQHEFNLVDMTFQHTLTRTLFYDSLVNLNPLLKESYADQFMIGSNYTYQYAIPESDHRLVRTAFTGSLEGSGNLLYGLQKLLGSKKPEGEQRKFLGAVYSQYVRVNTDFRVYVKLLPSDVLATRLSFGLGIPLGNSKTLPALKQFYLGGANTIRAYPFRSVGPGAYADTSTNNQFVLLNHTGELQFMGNIENRWKFAKRLELAIFLDVGNIWLLKNDPLRENAQFKGNQFLKQLAIGWGYGLRYLNEFFIIRVDVGIPLHVPNTIEKISEKKAIFNFAIGYPF